MLPGVYMLDAVFPAPLRPDVGQNPRVKVHGRTFWSFTLDSRSPGVEHAGNPGNVWVVGFLLTAIATCLVFYFCYAHAVSMASFSGVTNGMRKVQVQRMLGAPLFIRQDSTPQRTSFFYGGFLRLKFCTMEVYFDTNGLVTGKFHDH